MTEPSLRVTYLLPGGGIGSFAASAGVTHAIARVGDLHRCRLGITGRGAAVRPAAALIARLARVEPGFDQLSRGGELRQLRIVEVADGYFEAEELCVCAGDDPRHTHETVCIDALVAHPAAAYEGHLWTQGDTVAIDHEAARARPALMQPSHTVKGRCLGHPPTTISIGTMATAWPPSTPSSVWILPEIQQCETRPPSVCTPVPRSAPAGASAASMASSSGLSTLAGAVSSSVACA